MERILDLIFSFWGYPILMVIFGMVAIVAGVIRRHRINTWPAAQGTVETHRIATGAGNDATDIAEISYSYRIAGELYSGYYRQGIGKDDEGIVLFTACPKGSRVVVHYDPRHPECSEMETPLDAHFAPAMQ